MKLNIFVILLGGFMLIACKDKTIEPEVTPDDIEIQISEIDNRDTGPVLDCDETLSAIEMKEVWEMMNAKTHHEKHICFEGYVLSNETYGDLIQGSIAFKPFSEEDVTIPAVYCQFTGENGVSFLNYEIGDKIQIMGKLLTIDNPNKHNFMFTKCSLPMRDSDL